MSYVSIFVNITVMTFTSGTVQAVVEQIFGNTDDESATFDDVRFVIYSFLIIAMIFVKMAVQVSIDDVPRKFRQILKRHEILKERLMQKVRSNKGFQRSGVCTGTLYGDFPDYVVNRNIVYKEQQNIGEQTYNCKYQVWCIS